MILKTSKPYFYLLNSIKWQLLAVTVLIILTGQVGELVDKYTDIEHPIGIPAFFGTAIVFVLAFRTNQAYERWWEARKIWGAIVNDSRSWIRMVLNLINSDSQQTSVKNSMINRQLAWNHVLVLRLRNKNPSMGLEKYLSGEKLAQLQKSNYPNQELMGWQSRDLKKLLDQGLIDEWHHIELEECLKSLESSMGKAERIKNTHFPVLYDHLVHFSIYVFASLLSFAIVDSSHLFEISFTVLISGIFISLEFIAREMQDPFEDAPSDTPMTNIAHSIEKGARQLMGEAELPSLPNDGRFYIK